MEYDAQPPTMTGSSNSRMNFFRLSGWRAGIVRDVLGRHDRALDDEDVELGVEDVLRVLLDALRRERRGGDDAAGLDLADALRDELVLDRLVVELLHPARRLLGRQRGDLFEHRLGIFVARPDAFEVEAREPAETTDLDRGRRRDDAVHRGRHHRQLELVRVDLPRDVDVLGIACAAARHDRDVVEPVRPAPRLSDPDLNFHGASAVVATRNFQDIRLATRN